MQTIPGIPLSAEMYDDLPITPSVSDDRDELLRKLERSGGLLTFIQSFADFVLFLDDKQNMHEIRVLNTPPYPRLVETGIDAVLTEESLVRYSNKIIHMNIVAKPVTHKLKGYNIEPYISGNDYRSSAEAVLIILHNQRVQNSGQSQNADVVLARSGSSENFPITDRKRFNPPPGVPAILVQVTDIDQEKDNIPADDSEMSTDELITMLNMNEAVSADYQDLFNTCILAQRKRAVPYGKEDYITISRDDIMQEESFLWMDTHPGVVAAMHEVRDILNKVAGKN